MKRIVKCNFLWKWQRVSCIALLEKKNIFLHFISRSTNTIADPINGLVKIFRKRIAGTENNKNENNFGLSFQMWLCRLQNASFISLIQKNLADPPDLTITVTIIFWRLTATLNSITSAMFTFNLLWRQLLLAHHFLAYLPRVFRTFVWKVFNNKGKVTQ